LFNQTVIDQPILKWRNRLALTEAVSSHLWLSSLPPSSVSLVLAAPTVAAVQGREWATQ